MGLVAATEQFGVALQHANYSIKPAGINGYEKARMHTTNIQKVKAVVCSHSKRGTRIQDRRDPSQPGAPSTMGPLLTVSIFPIFASILE